ncbi:MAG: methyltransferase domain-containing protein [Bacteroidetes bacterium]|nr:methyltransferase domain-containing protein [Bacteroidota bacterium]
MPDQTIYEFDRIADRKRIDFIADSLQNTLPKTARILDVGCGNGVISRHLGRYGYNVTGIDVSEKAIEIAKKLNKYNNVRFETKSAEQLVAEGEKYDAIICSEVLEHLSNPDALLEVLNKSLTQNGKLLITVPNGKGPRESLVTKPVLKMRNKNTWAWKLITGLKKNMGYSGTTVQSAADNLDHIQFFSKKDIQQMSDKHNLKIVRFGKANFIEDVFPFSFFSKRIKVLQKIDCKVADWLPYYFTGGFFFVCEKTGS